MVNHVATMEGAGFVRDPALDSSWRLLQDGYEFISKRAEALGSDCFVTRLLGKRVVCLRGEEAAALFYDEARFERRNAVPRRVVTSLFGKGGVQGLDGEQHRQRKALFLAILSEQSVQKLADVTLERFRLARSDWQRRPTVTLFDASAAVLTQSVCDWAGVPLSAGDVADRAHDFVQMVDAFGGAGPRLWSGKLARRRGERWIRALIRDVRGGRVVAPPSSALAAIAGAQELPEQIAAVELINLLRPTVAIAWYVTFAAHALLQQPHCFDRLRDDAAAFDPGQYASWFIQELRRFYPFTPFLGARVKAPFEWRGQHFERGQLVLLDVYGALHDERRWQQPRRFEPERFAELHPGPFDFIPQGGGAPLGHRCAGEAVTLAVLGTALRFLTRELTYQVPGEQSFEIPLGRMPTKPRDGFIISHVAPA